MTRNMAALALGAALIVAAPLAAQDDAARQSDRAARLKAHEERIQQIIAEKRKAQEDAAARGGEQYRARVARGLFRQQADQMAAALLDAGYARIDVASESRDSASGPDRFAVSLTGFSSRQEAATALESLRRDGFAVSEGAIRGLIETMEPAAPGDEADRELAAGTAPTRLKQPPLPSRGKGEPDPFAVAEEASRPTRSDNLSSPPAERLVTCAFSQTKAATVFAKIAEITQVPVLAQGEVGAVPVTLIVRNQPLAATLKQLATPNNWVVVEPTGKNEAYEVWDRRSYTREVLPTMTDTRVFDVHEISVDEAMRALREVSTGVGRIVPVPSSRTVVMIDLPQALKDGEALLKQIDKKPASANATHAAGGATTRTAP